MDDLISRQGVIDALEKVANFFPYKTIGKRETYDKYNEAWNDAIGRAEMEIERLPSVNPQEPTSEQVEEYCRKRCLTLVSNEFMAHIIADSGKSIRTIPSAEPKTGHWVKGKCDQCGGHAPFWSMATTYYESEYCPNCGCRMVKPQESEE